MLNEVVDSVIAAVACPTARTKSLDETKYRRISADPGEESACACETRIHNIVQPAYQTIVDAEPAQRKKIRLLADFQKTTQGSVQSAATSSPQPSHDRYNSIFIAGFVDAVRAIYTQLHLTAEQITAKKLALHLASVSVLANGSV